MRNDKTSRLRRQPRITPQPTALGFAVGGSGGGVLHLLVLSGGELVFRVMRPLGGGTELAHMLEIFARRHMRSSQTHCLEIIP